MNEKVFSKNQQRSFKYIHELRNNYYEEANFVISKYSQLLECNALTLKAISNV